MASMQSATGATLSGFDNGMFACPCFALAILTRSVQTSHPVAPKTTSYERYVPVRSLLYLTEPQRSNDFLLCIMLGATTS